MSITFDDRTKATTEHERDMLAMAGRFPFRSFTKQAFDDAIADSVDYLNSQAKFLEAAEDAMCRVSPLPHRPLSIRQINELCKQSVAANDPQCSLS